MATTEYPVLKAGDKAFYEAYGYGKLPCKVIEIKGKEGLPSVSQRVRVRLTIYKPKAGFEPGDEVTTFCFRVFPRETITANHRNMAYKLLTS
jgi:hypothetical protein